MGNSCREPWVKAITWIIVSATCNSSLRTLATNSIPERSIKTQVSAGIRWLFVMTDPFCQLILKKVTLVFHIEKKLDSSTITTTINYFNPSLSRVTTSNAALKRIDVGYKSVWIYSALQIHEYSTKLGHLLNLMPSKKLTFVSLQIWHYVWIKEKGC